MGPWAWSQPQVGGDYGPCSRPASEITLLTMGFDPAAFCWATHFLFIIRKVKPGKTEVRTAVPCGSCVAQRLGCCSCVWRVIGSYPVVSLLGPWEWLRECPGRVWPCFLKKCMDRCLLSNYNSECAIQLPSIKTDGRSTEVCPVTDNAEKMQLAKFMIYTADGSGAGGTCQILIVRS